MVKGTARRKGGKGTGARRSGTTGGQKGGRRGPTARAAAASRGRRRSPKPRERGANRAPAKPRGALAGLGRAEGCAASVVVAERAGRERELVLNDCAIIAGDGGKKANNTRVGGQKRGAGRAPKVSLSTCRALAAVGHVVRVRLLTKLLEGPATYRALQRLTKLKPGPLYHHVNQLRLAGLIRPKQRDLYELTRGGRNLILTIMAVAPLIRDSRRRPLAVSKA